MMEDNINHIYHPTWIIILKPIYLYYSRIIQEI